MCIKDGVPNYHRPIALALDPCCGSRMMWHDREHQFAVYGDIRRENLTVTDRSHGNASGTRELNISPDIEMDFRNLPFADGMFDLVVFDPPHLVRAGGKSWLAAKYGKLTDDWRSDLADGGAECLRVLRPGGTMIFKWNETQIKLRDILPCIPARPLFGHTSTKNLRTHWIVFLKPYPIE